MLDYLLFCGWFAIKHALANAVVCKANDSVDRDFCDRAHPVGEAAPAAKTAAPAAAPVITDNAASARAAHRAGRRRANTCDQSNRTAIDARECSCKACAGEAAAHCKNGYGLTDIPD